MLNITLPAFSLNHTSTSGNVLDYQELENLVLREKTVVWADQEAHQPKGVGTEEESAAGGGELAPILSFSHLRYHTSSPCSKSSVRHLLPVMRLLPVSYYLTRAQQVPLNFKVRATTVHGWLTFCSRSCFCFLQDIFAPMTDDFRKETLSSHFLLIKCVTSPTGDEYPQNFWGKFQISIKWEKKIILEFQASLCIADFPFL